MKLIINADDFGMSKEVNKAIDICMKKNFIQRTTLMLNMPETEEAIKLAKKNGYMDRVGLHLNVVEGTPLTEKIKSTKLCNKGGTFNKLFFRDVKHRFFLNKVEKQAVREEIEKQMQTYIECGFTCLHLDSHEHSHINISIFFIIMDLAKKYGFKSMRLARNIPTQDIKGLKNIYKKIINREIEKYNQVYLKQASQQFFGAKIDCEKEGIFSKTKEYKGSMIEMMIHPIYKYDKIFDHCTQEILFEEKLWT